MSFDRVTNLFENLRESEKKLIEEFLADLSWINMDIMESEEMDKLEGIIRKWEARLKG